MFQRFKKIPLRIYPNYKKIQKMRPKLPSPLDQILGQKSPKYDLNIKIFKK